MLFMAIAISLCATSGARAADRIPPDSVQNCAAIVALLAKKEGWLAYFKKTISGWFSSTPTPEEKAKLEADLKAQEEVISRLKADRDQCAALGHSKK